VPFKPFNCICDKSEKPLQSNPQSCVAPPDVGTKWSAPAPLPPSEVPKLPDVMADEKLLPPSIDN